VFAILVRLGLWLLLGAVIALALPRFRRLSRERQVLLALLGTTVLMFIALHTLRLGFDRGHSFHLYYDRYLVSEVLPSIIIMSALAASAAIPWLVRRRLTVPAALVLGAVVLIPSAGELALQSEDSYMAGAYQFTTKLASFDTGGSAATGAKLPIVWSGSSLGKAPGFFFPNTWMAFALPMKTSFGLDVLNADQDRNNMLPDEVLTAKQLAGYLACGAGNNRAVVYEAETGGPSLDTRLTGSDITLTRLGDAVSDISLLSQPAGRGWTHARIHVIVWLASDPGQTRTTVCPRAPSH
jgi:uncharacterized membrane protein